MHLWKKVKYSSYLYNEQTAYNTITNLYMVAYYNDYVNKRMHRWKANATKQLSKITLLTTMIIYSWLAFYSI